MDPSLIPNLALREIQTIVAEEISLFASFARTDRRELFVAKRKEFEEQMMPRQGDDRVTAGRKIVYSAKIWVAEEMLRFPLQFIGYSKLLHDVQACTRNFFSGVSTEVRAIGNSIAHTVYSTVHEYNDAIETANESERKALRDGLDAVNAFMAIPARWGQRQNTLQKTMSNIEGLRFDLDDAQYNSRFNEGIPVI